MNFQKYCDQYNDNSISKNAYHYCKNINDKRNVRILITESQYAYKYCLNLIDKKSVRVHIIESVYAYLYCRYIEDRVKIREKITHKKHIKKLDAYLNGED
ncbi:MAG: hypothetical protein ACJA0H_001187 [Francisellaceae bacterium]|jgi:hypothetical protein